jgi:chromosome partitioning protein
MLRILIASSKGGCGKSTVATNLAAHFAQSGKNTVLADTDRQGSSYRWCERRPMPLPGVLGIAAIRKGWRSQLPPDSERLIIDSAAGTHAGDVAELADELDAIVVPVLPSAFDLDASAAFVAELSQLPRIKRGKLPVAIVANRLKPWTSASQDGLARMQELGLPVVAELRDSTGYVVLAGLGKSIFDFHSEQARSHQEDWAPLLKWLKKL